MADTTREKDWVALEVTLPLGMMDAVANFFHERGSRGVVIDDEAEHAASVTAYFPKRDWERVHAELSTYLARLAELFETGEPRVRVTPFKEEDWSTIWQAYFTPLPVGKGLIVTPPWLHPDPYGREIIIIEPADAFGTGTHETTQGCLILLERALEQLRGSGRQPTLIDVGCGTGILAIAGIKLGATTALALDNDPVAAEATRHNALLNRVEDRLRVNCGELDDVAESADIVTANLDRLTLLGSREKLLSLASEFLIISGVPSEYWEEVREAFLVEGVTLVEQITRAEWGCGLFGKHV